MNITIRRNGLFYDIFDDDAYIMHYLFGYKILKPRRCSFPKNSLNKVKNILDGKKINYIIINEDDNIEEADYGANNSYAKFLEKAKNFELQEIKIDTIISKISELNEEKLDRIINFIEGVINEE